MAVSQKLAAEYVRGRQIRRKLLQRLVVNIKFFAKLSTIQKRNKNQKGVSC
jgi:hypothetical protein